MGSFWTPNSKQYTYNLNMVIQILVSARLPYGRIHGIPRGMGIPLSTFKTDIPSGVQKYPKTLNRVNRGKVYGGPKNIRNGAHQKKKKTYRPPWGAL